MQALLCLLLLLLPAANRLQAETDISTQQKLEALTNACMQSRSLVQKENDKVCQAIVIFKNVGDDAIESVKEYMNLTPRDYAVLTAVNYVVTGRLRIRTRSFFLKNTNHTLDIKKEEVFFITEISF